MASAWLAGATHMRLCRFAAFNALGGIGWAASVGGAAYALGTAGAHALLMAGAPGIALIATFAIRPVAGVQPINSATPPLRGARACGRRTGSWRGQTPLPATATATATAAAARASALNARLRPGKREARDPATASAGQGVAVVLARAKHHALERAAPKGSTEASLAKTTMRCEALYSG